MLEALYILTAILVVVAVLQPTEERLAIGGLFAVLSAVHFIVMLNAEGLLYYGSAALCDLIVILASVRIKHASRTIIAIQHICIASIVLNCVGWVMWMTYMPPHAYNASFIALYAWAIVTLIRKDDANARDDKLDSRPSIIRFNHHKGGHSSQ